MRRFSTPDDASSESAPPDSFAALAAWLDQNGATLLDALRAIASASGKTRASAGDIGRGSGASAAPGAAADANSAVEAFERLNASLGTLQSNAESALQHTVVSGLHATSAALTDALRHTRNWGEAFVQLGRQVVQTLIEIALKMAVVESLQAAFGVGGFFANGGPVGVAHFAGGGPAGDDIPAMVSAGEYIVRASAAAQVGPGFLAGVNQGFVDLSRLGPGARVAGAAGGPTAPSGSPAIHLHMHTDAASAVRAALEDPSVAAAVVDLTRRNIRQITG
jgi:hypothetical protein